MSTNGTYGDDDQEQQGDDANEALEYSHGGSCGRCWTPFITVVGSYPASGASGAVCDCDVCTYAYLKLCSGLDSL